jgi:hypothetical protein
MKEIQVNHKPFEKVPYKVVVINTKGRVTYDGVFGKSEIYKVFRNAQECPMPWRDVIKKVDTLDAEPRIKIGKSYKLRLETLEGAKLVIMKGDKERIFRGVMTINKLEAV